MLEELLSITVDFSDTSNNIEKKFERGSPQRWIDARSDLKAGTDF